LKIMAEPSTPRRMIKAVLQGNLPARPLLMPIIFALGARLENLPLRDFQSNPTKIVNALRQIRSVLRVDGLTCYFDPFMEAEALGCKREWNADGSCVLACPSFSDGDDLREKLNSPGSLTDKGGIRVACEVLRRLKVMLKDEPALMVSVTGPFALAAQLSKAKAANASAPRYLVEFAAEVTASVSKTFVESGADVVLLRESMLPEISSQTGEWWASLLAPIINVIRFYEALPVLLLDPPEISQGTLASILNSLECVLCPALARVRLAHRDTSAPKRSGMGVGLPPEVFGEDQDASALVASIRELFRDQRLTLVTSTGDLPAGGDLKRLAGALDALRVAFSGAA
jgi:hypothetical protein